MLATPVLDVAIGLSFFFLLLALICTAVGEMFASWRDTRSKYLDRGIDRLLNCDAAFKKELYQHPLIKSLKPQDDRMPSYLPAEKFATALLDNISGGRPTDMAAVAAGASGDADYQKAIRALIQISPDAGALHKNVEEWFNSGMDRVTGWYKKNAQRNAVVLASLVTLMVNADALSVARILWTNPAVRATVVSLAEKRSKEPPPATASTPAKAPSSPEEALLQDEQKELGELTGWKRDRDKFGGTSGWCQTAWEIISDHFLGWLITALAVSLGAPFWFDTLNRFMNIRNAGRAPDEPRDKSSSAASQQVMPPAAPQAAPQAASQAAPQHGAPPAAPLVQP